MLSLTEQPITKEYSSNWRYVRLLCALFILKQRSSYQDRLGTNIGKVGKEYTRAGGTSHPSIHFLLCPEPVLANGLVHHSKLRSISSNQLRGAW
jgi:hypothetical protein